MQEIINGFPQYKRTKELKSTYTGLSTDHLLDYKDLDLSLDTDGDSILVDDLNIDRLSVYRDGIFLHRDKGFILNIDNTIRIEPSFLEGEVVEFIMQLV